jgi:cell division protein FtsL
MMYSQEEYDQVRRQTMQMEGEKRAVLRLGLIVVTLLLVAALLVLSAVWVHYRSREGIAEAAEAKAGQAEAALAHTRTELEQKTQELERLTNVATKRSETVDRLTPRVVAHTSAAEMAQFAHAVYETPGHMVELPKVPPNELLKRFKYTVNGQTRTYQVIPGFLNGKWVVYSNLVGYGSK